MPSIPARSPVTRPRSCAIPSVTGDERPVLEALAELAAGHGLATDLHAHDLAALRAHPDHPGEEAARDELWGLTATLAGGAPRRLCLNGHVDVVGPGTAPWRHGPWSGAVEDGRLHGRGAVDMKGAVVAALHALAAVRTVAEAAPEVVLQCVASEEDGGLGTFAELERDAAFDAALIPEPTGFDVVCAQAGALTFRCVVPGRAAHAGAPARGLLGDRPLRARARGAARARARDQRRRRASADARAGAAVPAARRARGRRRVVEPGARPGRGRGPRRRAGGRRPGGRAGGARERGGRRSRRRRGAGRGALDRRRVPARRDAHGPPVGACRCRCGRGRARPRRRAPPACRGAPTCACSPRAESRARWPARPGSSARTRSTSGCPSTSSSRWRGCSCAVILRAALVPSSPS